MDDRLVTVVAVALGLVIPVAVIFIVLWFG
jgi:hypothetical protein